MYIGEHCGAVKFQNANVSLMAAKEKGHRDTSTWEMQVRNGRKKKHY
jgi:hypothetical protein